jgi:putative CocE/NonD family hydrolase
VPHPHVRPLLALALLALTIPMAAPAPVSASPRGEYIRSHYTKYEYRIPMRDGARLFTAVYVPNDASAAKRYPILFMRTPYSVGPYGADRYPERLAPAESFERDGFIFVDQDVRGRYMSEGEFVNMRPLLDAPAGRQPDESTDSWDTIDWLVKHVESNSGKVGMWGLSYGGFYASTGMIDTHPALVAASPQAPIADWFWDDMHRHGTFNEVLAFAFFSSFGQPRDSLTVEHAERFDMKTPDAYDFLLAAGPLGNLESRYLKGNVAFWKDITSHPDYDAFWKARRVPPHLKNVRCAVLTVGGWFDTEDLYGALNTYAAVEGQNPKTANRLVMGPWSHGQWIRDDGDTLGSARFGFTTATWYQDHVALPFFRQHLKGGADADLPEALVFETGANRWRRFDSWPPAGVTTRDLYLREGGTLAGQPSASAGEAGDAYVSDPAKPVPYTADLASGWSATYMTEDQRFAARRPDVLVYRSEPLAEDLTLAGPLDAEIWLTTTGTDADVVVKLIDEFPGAPAGYSKDERAQYPGGRQMLVRGEPFRGRFRDSYETPKPFTPGEPARVKYRINDVCHTFERGHRIMVQVQNTWFPFIDRNPQTFVPNIFEAKESDFVPATMTVLHSKDHASRLTVRVQATP